MNVCGFSRQLVLWTVSETLFPTTVDRANCREHESIYTGEFPTIFETTVDKRIAEYRNCITMARSPPSLRLCSPQLLTKQVTEYIIRFILGRSPPSFKLCSPQLLMEQIAECRNCITMARSPLSLRLCSPTTVDRANCRVHKSLYTGEFPTIFETTVDKRIAEYRNCITMARSPPSLRLCSPQPLIEQDAEYTVRFTLTSSTPLLRLSSPTAVDRANCRVHQSLYSGEARHLWDFSGDCVPRQLLEVLMYESLQRKWTVTTERLWVLVGDLLP